MTLLYILALVPLPILFLTITYFGAKQTAEKEGVSIWAEYCVFFLIIIFVLIQNCERYMLKNQILI